MNSLDKTKPRSKGTFTRESMVKYKTWTPSVDHVPGPGPSSTLYGLGPWTPFHGASFMDRSMDVLFSLHLKLEVIKDFECVLPLKSLSL